MAANDVNITIRALDKTKSGFSSVTRGLKSVAGGIFSLKAGLAGVIGAGGIGLLVRQSLNATDALAKTASRIGTTTEALGRLQYAGKITGVEVNTMNMAMQRFTRRVSEAAKGTGEAQGALRELNLDAGELQRLPLDQQMVEVANAFGGVGSEADKVRLAFKLFDSEGVALVNTLNLGSEEMKLLMNEADTLGIVLSQDAARGVEQANDAFFRLSQLFRGIRDQTVAALAPTLEYLATLLKDEVLKRIKETSDNVEEFGKTLATFVVEAIGNTLIAIGSFINGLVDLYNGSLKAINGLRDLIGWESIGTEMTYTFGNAVTGAGQNVLDYAKNLREAADAAKGITGDGEATAQISMFGQALRNAGNTIPEMQQSLDKLVTSSMSGFTGAITDAVTGAKSLKDAFKDMASSIINDLIRMLVQYYITKPLFDALAGAFGAPVGGGTGGGGKAIGGSVQAGKAYMVGERGQELFIPNQSGSIVSNDKLGGAGGVVVNQTINVSTGVQQTVRAEIQNLMPQIANSAKAAVAETRMRGGSYSKALVGA